MYKYPDIDELKTDSLLFNRNVYFIQVYQPGISLKTCTIDRDVKITPFNWDGSHRDLCDELLEGAMQKNDSILQNFIIAGINKYQIFFDDELKIVDLVVNDEFVSPGMLNSLLANHYSIQNVLAQGVLTEESLAKMIKDYKHFIIKPMTKLCIDNQKHKPNYARIL